MPWQEQKQGGAAAAAAAACLLLHLLLAARCSAVQLYHAQILGEGTSSLGRRFGAGSSSGSGGSDRLAPPAGLLLQGRRYRLQLRYTACTGLVNQQYSHIAAFTLAAALGVSEVHLPPAAVRDSFGHKFSVHQEQNQMQWFPARSSCLLDVQRLQQTWARMGVAVHEARTLLPFPDLMLPAGAFQLTPPPPGIDPRAVVRVGGVYLSGMDLPQLVAHVRQAVERHLAALRSAFPALQPRELLLELPCMFFALHTTSMLPTVSQVAATLHFNPSLEYLAERVVSYITRDGRRRFNGAHLRVEKDAAEWFIILGGAPVVWAMYREAMRDAGFNALAPLYVATGLLSYGAEQEFQSGVNLLISHQLCSEVLYKEQYLPAFELQRLNSEQLALLDFLILARAYKFVGFGPSTFSFYLREHRMLNGLPASQSTLVNASRIGTDELFSRSALVAQRTGEGAGLTAASGGQAAAVMGLG